VALPEDMFAGENTALHHVGVICRSEAAADRLIGLTGLEERERGFVPQYEALCVFCGTPDSSYVELVIPSGGTLKDFNKGAGGLHHIAIAVPSLRDLQGKLKQAGIDLLEEEPVRGAGDFYCNFLSPVHTGGVIIEYVELDSPDSA
jgi:methylmalonyl-CoA/ethylmalonyl-CoA epimerase